MVLQIDSGNVVTVFYENHFYLAYIQDIRDTDALVDFHCEALPPTWISLYHVWPQMFRNLLRDVESGKDIRVAVRDDRDGPLRFRPGRFSDLQVVYCHFPVLYVEWISSLGTKSKTVVHHTQIMGGDPLPQQSLFFMLHRNTDYSFLKLTLPLGISCSSVAIASTDLSELRQIIKEMLFTKGRTAVNWLYHPSYNHFHVNLAGDSMFFTFWETSAIIDNIQWTNDDIIGIVTKWNTQRCLVKNEVGGKERNDDIPFKILHLPDFILHQILTDLEIHDLINSRRVCRLWKNHLDNVFQLEHIKIDLHRRRQKLCCGEYVWDLGGLLDKLLHRRGKTLTIMNADNTPLSNMAALTPVRSVAAVKSIRFKAIALVSGHSVAQISVDKVGRLSGDWGEIMPFTDLLIVRNYKLEWLMCSTASTYNDPLQDKTYVHQLLQAQGISAERSPLLGVLIPYILFDFRQSEAETFYTLLTCIERCCPDVSYKDKSTALAVYRYLISAQLPQRLLETKDIAKKWKSLNPGGRSGDTSDMETGSLGAVSLSKVSTYAVLCLFKLTTTMTF